MHLLLQVTQHPAAPAALPSFADVAGPAGGFIALVILAILGGKGAYKIAMAAIEMARGFGAGVIAEWRRSNDEMRSWIAQHAAEEIGVMREIRDSLMRAAVDRERQTAEIKAAVERTAKETRHDLRNSVQALLAPPEPEDERAGDERAGARGRDRAREHDRERDRDRDRERERG